MCVKVDQNLIIVTVISTIIMLLGLYLSFERAMKEPIQKLSTELKQMHEDFTVEMSKQAGRIEKNQENIDKTQKTLQRVQEQLTKHETRISILERNDHNGK